MYHLLVIGTLNVLQENCRSTVSRVELEELQREFLVAIFQMLQQLINTIGYALCRKFSRLSLVWWIKRTFGPAQRFAVMCSTFQPLFA